MKRDAQIAPWGRLPR